MTLAVSYISTSSPFEKIEGAERQFRKQLIYEGDFVKDSAGQKRQEFSVSKEDIDHWVAVHASMVANGVKVPLPLEHTMNPELNRGDVLSLEAGADEKGRYALFGTIEFADDEAMKLASRTDVSIFVPPQFTDGKGNVYYKPIRHVALTSYPVIPSLDGWEVIAASFSEPMENSDMPLKEDLAKALSIELTEDMDDEAFVKAVKAKTTKAADPPKDDDDGEGDPKPKPKIAAGFLSMARDNRHGKVDKLVSEGKITPAVAKKLKETHCSDEVLTLSLDAEGNSNDAFDATVAALSENEPIMSFGEQTGPQSQYNKENPNPLLADAEGRKD